MDTRFFRCILQLEPLYRKKLLFLNLSDEGWVIETIVHILKIFIYKLQTLGPACLLSNEKHLDPTLNPENQWNIYKFRLYVYP